MVASAQRDRVIIRPARDSDAPAALPLIYSSGPEAFEYVFSIEERATALQFLARAFADGRSQFGWRNHVVADVDGVVAGSGAAWTQQDVLRFTVAAARGILKYYGWRHAAGVIARGLRTERVVRPPGKETWYVAHLGVAPEWRSHGVGAAIVQHLLAQGRARGLRRAALDVAVTNPRAQALYERLGFVVEREWPSTLENRQGKVVAHRRMTMALE